MIIQHFCCMCVTVELERIVGNLFKAKDLGGGEVNEGSCTFPGAQLLKVVPLDTPDVPFDPLRPPGRPWRSLDPMVHPL